SDATSPPADGADAPPGTTCYGDSFAYACIPPPTVPVLANSDTVVDTGATNAVCTVVMPPYAPVPECVIAGTSATIETLHVAGPYPLVVIGVDTIAVMGTLDVAAGASVWCGGQSGSPGMPVVVMPGGGGGASGGGGGGAGGSLGGQG